MLRALSTLAARRLTLDTLHMQKGTFNNTTLMMACAEVMDSAL